MFLKPNNRSTLPPNSKSNCENITHLIITRRPALQNFGADGCGFAIRKRKGRCGV